MARPKLKQRKFPGPKPAEDQDLPSDGKIVGSGYNRGQGKRKTPTTKVTKGPRASYGDPFTAS